MLMSDAPPNPATPLRPEMSMPLYMDGAQAAAEPLPNISGYRILELLGRGSMGTVWRASSWG